MSKKTPSQTPAAVRARANRALKALAARDAAAVQAVESEAQAESAPSNPAVFAALAASLSAEESAHAGAQARAALSKARAVAAVKAAPSVKPADTARYTVGAYKGRAGAMYAFMKRCGELVGAHPAGYTREAVVSSCALKAPHAAVATRAQVLDYFAWAVRHGLLVEESAPLPLAAAAAAAPRGDGELRALS